jgi:spermidine/putrescine transport system substrate-binding protein
MKNEEVWIAHIEDANGRKLSQFDSKFRYILPKTGGVGWIDTFMIPKTAVNPNEANIFINFMLRSDIAAVLTEQSGFKTTVEDALYNTKNIEKDLYKFTQKQLEKLLWIPNLSEKERSMTAEFWEELITINN